MVERKALHHLCFGSLRLAEGLLEITDQIVHIPEAGGESIDAVVVWS